MTQAKKPSKKSPRRVRLRLTVALPAIVTLLTFGAGILAVNLCKITLFDPFGKLRVPPYPLNQIYLWVAGYALFCGLIGFLFAYFILHRPIQKGLETLKPLFPPERAPFQKAETETILLAQTLASLYPTLGRLKMTHSLLEALQGGILWVGPEKTLLFTNQKALYILGNTPSMETPLPSTLTALTRNLEDPDPLLSIIDRGLLARQYVSSQIITLKIRGERSIKIGITSSPIGMETQPEGVLLSFREISEIHKLQKDLTRLDRLSTLGRLASGLVHEIRNPLGSLMGLIEILRDEVPPANGETRDLINRIYQVANRIQHLLAEVLDFAGPSDLSIQTISLIPLLDQAIDETYAAYKERRFHLIKDFPTEDDGPKIRADGEKLRQALINILRNAMEAVNENGEVRVIAKSAGTVSWEIEIFNSGSTISEADMEKIFDPFFTTKPRGTGLGLPIARELITLQGGRLSLASDPKRGVSFYIQFPGESL